MATLRQAIERQREVGTLPTIPDISVKNLHMIYGPIAGKSTRGLQAVMFLRNAQMMPWAVILCRFKGQTPNHAVEDPVKDLYVKMFTPGTGGLVEYWRDVSLGAIDITGSRVFDWVEVEIPRSKAGGSEITVPKGPGRAGLADCAVRALQKRGDDPLTGFRSHIAVYTTNWSEDNKSQTGDWASWAPFWLDGSSDNTIVTLTPPHEGDITAHEMGHVFGMGHDVSADLRTHYADPCCIMSQVPVFAHPTIPANFGPAVCLPHLVQRGWMYNHRLFDAGNAWQSQPGGITIPLARLDDPGAQANLGIALQLQSSGGDWTYYVQYVRPIDWNRGLVDDYLMIRRIANADIGPTPSILGQLVVPSAVGAIGSLIEPIGDVRFDVQRMDRNGRVVKVTAVKR